MKLEEADLDHLARLARIRLTPVERASLREDLERILEFMAILDGVDLGADAPVPEEAGGSGALRSDEVQTPLTNDAALAAAPDSRDGHFVVPAVVRRDPGTEGDAT